MNQMIRNTRQKTNKRLDNSPQPGAAARDELVPSRYALRVGEIDVMVISDGVLTPPAESMATNANPAVRAAWLDDMFLSHDAFDWALNEVVVRSGDQTILIDSGLGGEYPDFKRAGQLGLRLEAGDRRGRQQEEQGRNPQLGRKGSAQGGQPDHEHDSQQDLLRRQRRHGVTRPPAGMSVQVYTPIRPLSLLVGTSRSH